MLMVETRNLVGRNWVSAGSGDTIPVCDPATDERIADVPRCTRPEFEAAVDAAAAALPEWRERTGPDRSLVLRRLHDEVAARARDLARTISSESGKPLTEAMGEVAYAAGFLEWASEEAKRVNGETLPASKPNKRILVLRQPVGVTAAITPWNFPLAMLTRKLGPALAAGCTQVVKPASQTPLTAIALCEIAAAVDVPPGVVNVVTGSGSEFADVVLSDPRVRKLSFTGSTEVGQDLVRKSAKTLARLSLELGGHAPVIVLPDADMDVAVVQSITAKFRNTGQSCIAANRFFVHRSRIKEFGKAFAEAVSGLRLGPWTEEADVGPLIDDDAVSKVTAHVEDARTKGAEILCGGGVRDLGPGFTNRFFEPTVLLGVDDEMLISTEETFGPVAGIAVYDDEDEVIRRANDSPYGLAAYVFGSDLSRTTRLVEALDYGVVGVNDGLPSTAQAPFGGMKMSGFGREGGHYVMAEYLDTKYVSLAL